MRFLLNELASKFVEAVKKGQEIQFVAGNCSHTVARNPTGVGRLVQGSDQESKGVTMDRFLGENDW